MLKITFLSVECFWMHFYNFFGRFSISAEICFRLIFIANRRYQIYSYASGISCKIATVLLGNHFCKHPASSWKINIWSRLGVGVDTGPGFRWKLCKKAPQSRPDDYLARFCQNLAKTVYLARSARKIVILQDLPEKWLSCKILAISFRSSCPLIGSHSSNTFHFDQKFA